MHRDKRMGVGLRLVNLGTFVYFSELGQGQRFEFINGFLKKEASGCSALPSVSSNSPQLRLVFETVRPCRFQISAAEPSRDW